MQNRDDQIKGRKDESRREVMNTAELRVMEAPSGKVRGRVQVGDVERDQVAVRERSYIKGEMRRRVVLSEDQVQ